jgi:small subunit ribosomal protein S7
VSRRKKSVKRIILPDARYDSQTVSKFINSLMYRARRPPPSASSTGDGPRRGSTSQPGVNVFKQALNNLKPVVEVKSRRVGGATYQVPVEVRPERRTALAMRWLIGYSRDRNEKSMAEKLAAEVIAAPRAKATPSRRRKTRTAWPKPTRRSRTIAGSSAASTAPGPSATSSRSRASGPPSPR